MIGIYKITNRINNKSYIGQSVNIERRWSRHINEAEKINGLDYPLYRAIKKYGKENFLFEVIEECEVEDLDEREKYWIAYFNSWEDGYNQTHGGTDGYSFKKLNHQLLDLITKDLEDEQLLLSEIAKKYDIGIDMLSMINNGKAHVRDIEYPIRKTQIKKEEIVCPVCGVIITKGAKYCKKCSDINQRKIDRPDPELLLKEVALNGFLATGKKYGVTDNSIRRWLKWYGLPFSIKEVQQMYGNWVEPKSSIKSPMQTWQEIVMSNPKNPSERRSFNSTRTAAEFLIEAELTSANIENVQGGIGRVLNGKRKTYLGLNWEGIKKEN